MSHFLRLTDPKTEYIVVCMRGKLNIDQLCVQGATSWADQVEHEQGKSNVAGALF